MTKSAICLVVDRLQAGFIGCYGNTWVHTPQIDRLAGESAAFDQAIIDSPQLDVAYRSLWQGIHAAVPVDDRDATTISLPAALAAAGVKTALLTDELAVAEHPLAAAFAERAALELPGEARVADGVETTRMAQFFAAAAEWLRQAEGPYLLWLHTRGLAWPWDAPLEFRNQFADEEDPAPPDSAEVPLDSLSDDFDPDEIWGYAQAYAGQVALLDTCLGAMLDELRGMPANTQPLVALVSPRGFPLGEHHRVGPVDDALYGELVQVPLLIRWPDETGAAARIHSLVQPPDLNATLHDWWGLSPAPQAVGGCNLLPIVRGEAEQVRDRAITVAAGESAIRTAAWHLRVVGTPDHAGTSAAAGPAATAANLFVKPDDRFEANEVSNRCPDVVTGLIEAMGQFEAAAKVGAIDKLPALDAVLVEGLD